MQLNILNKLYIYMMNYITSNKIKTASNFNARII